MLLNKVICGDYDSEITSFSETNNTIKYDTHEEYFREEVLKIKKKALKVKARGGESKETTKTEKEQEDLLQEENKAEDEPDDSNLIDFEEEKKVEKSTKQTKQDDDLFDLDNKDNDDLLGGYGETKAVPTKAKETSKPESILDLEDAFSGPSPLEPPSPPQVPQTPTLSLNKVADLDPNTFQQKWMTLTTFPTIQRKVNASKAPSIQGIWDILSAKYIFWMANGQVNEYLKMYLYSQLTGSGLFLMELLININTWDLSLTLKTDRGDQAESYAIYVLSTLGPIWLA